MDHCGKYYYSKKNCGSNEYLKTGLLIKRSKIHRDILLAD